MTGAKDRAELDFWKSESRDVSDHDLTRYPRHLKIPEDHFAGRNVLDVGCGPIPYASAFTGCDICGVDPNLSAYASMGYDLGLMDYCESRAENMPFPDGYFDAVISMNALDHVDDFYAVAREILRVCSGEVRIEVHYHHETVAEPHALSDEAVIAAFGGELVKICETPYSEYYPGSDGVVAVWSRIVIA